MNNNDDITNNITNTTPDFSNPILSNNYKTVLGAFENFKRNMSIKINSKLHKTQTYAFGFVGEFIDTQANIIFYDDPHLSKKFPKGFVSQNNIFVNASYFSTSTLNAQNTIAALICQSLAQNTMHRDKLFFMAKKHRFEPSIEDCPQISLNDLQSILKQYNISSYKAIDTQSRILENQQEFLKKYSIDNKIAQQNLLPASQTSAQNTNIENNINNSLSEKIKSSQGNRFAQQQKINQEALRKNRWTTD